MSKKHLRTSSNSITTVSSATKAASTRTTSPAPTGSLRSGITPVRVAFAAGGLLQLQFGSALGASDLEAARLLVQPDFVVNADPSTLKPAERSLEEIFGGQPERLAQVASFQMWIAVPEWMSSEVCVSLLEMRGRDTAARSISGLGITSRIPRRSARLRP